jgi:hypothetical protein
MIQNYLRYQQILMNLKYLMFLRIELSLMYLKNQKYQKYPM